MERTSDPQRLGRHLAASLHEIAEYAARVGQTEDLRKIRSTLNSVYHQLQNATYQVSEHSAAVDEALEFRELPQWDVAAEEGRDEADASSDNGRTPSRQG